MSKGAKVGLVIVGLFAVIMLCLYLFFNEVHDDIPKELEFPPSGLSQSIFDSQNMKYKPNANYTDVHYFQRSPYTIDIAPADAAKVSDYGWVYEISDTSYFYITEFEKGSNIEASIRNELSPAVMVDSNASMTAIDNYVYDEGYINGFKGDYYIDGMTVTNGTRTASVYLVGYALTITDSTYDHGWKMFVGVMTARSDTDSYANAKAILDSVVATYKVSDSTQKTLNDEEARAERAAAEAKKQAEKNGTTYIEPQQGQQTQENLIVNTNNSSTDMAAAAQEGPIVPPSPQGTDTQQMGNSQSQAQQTLPNDQIRQDAYLNNNVNNNAAGDQGQAAGANIPQQKTKAMSLDKDYENVTLYYYYENIESEVVVSLTSPDGTQTFHPTSQAGGTAVFKLDKMVMGKWHVNIQGDPGNDNMKLYSESMQAGNAEGDAQSGETAQ